MSNRDTSCCLAYTGVAVWIVHRIFDVTIFHEITNFTDCHFRTVVLRLLCGSTKMRCYGCIWALERTRATELMVPVPRPACVMTEMPVESIRSPKKKMSARINMVPVVLNLRPAARDGRKRRRGAAVARRLLRRSSGVVGLTRKSNFIRKDRAGRFSGNAFDRAESLARSS